MPNVFDILFGAILLALAWHDVHRLPSDNFNRKIGVFLAGWWTAGVVISLLGHDTYWAAVQGVLAALWWWWLFKNKPPRKRKKSRVAGVVRAVNGRLRVVPVPNNT